MPKAKPDNSSDSGDGGEIVINHNPPLPKTDPGTKINHDQPQPATQFKPPAVGGIAIAPLPDMPMPVATPVSPPIEPNKSQTEPPVETIPTPQSSTVVEQLAPAVSNAEEEKVIATQKEEIEIQKEQIKLLKDLVDTFDSKHMVSNAGAMIDKTKFFERQTLPSPSPTVVPLSDTMLNETPPTAPLAVPVVPTAVTPEGLPSPVVNPPISQPLPLSMTSPANPPKTKSRPQLILMAAIALLVLCILVVLAIALLAKNQYRTETLTNNKTTYSFLFDSTASAEKSDGQNYLTGYDLKHQDLIGILASPSSYQQVCDQHFQPITTVFSFSYDKKQYPVCTVAKSYSDFTNVDYSGSWQQITIYSVNQKTPIDTTTAKTILGSLKIERQ